MNERDQSWLKIQTGVVEIWTTLNSRFLFQFGGNDILQIYNTSQVKHRLNTTGMYIASTKVLLSHCIENKERNQSVNDTVTHLGQSSAGWAKIQNHQRHMIVQTSSHCLIPQFNLSGLNIILKTKMLFLEVTLAQRDCNRADLPRTGTKPGTPRSQSQAQRATNVYQCHQRAKPVSDSSQTHTPGLLHTLPQDHTVTSHCVILYCRLQDSVLKSTTPVVRQW